MEPIRNIAWYNTQAARLDQITKELRTMRYNRRYILFEVISKEAIDQLTLLREAALSLQEETNAFARRVRKPTLFRRFNSLLNWTTKERRVNISIIYLYIKWTGNTIPTLYLCLLWKLRLYFYPGHCGYLLIFEVFNLRKTFTLN